MHLSHIFFTDGRTFTVATSSPIVWETRLLTRLLSAGNPGTALRLLVPVGDPTPAEIVRGESHLHLVARCDSDVMHPYLPGDLCEHPVPVLQLDAKHGVRQRLHDHPLYQDRIVLLLYQRVHHLKLRRAEARKIG